MRTLAQYIEEQTRQEPEFPARLRETKAEVHLGVQIARVREEKGWTQQELADRTGIPQSSLARYERATRTPTIGTLWRIATALNAAFMLGPDFHVNLIPCTTRVTSGPASTGDSALIGVSASGAEVDQVLFVSRARTPVVRVNIDTSDPDHLAPHAPRRSSITSTAAA